MAHIATTLALSGWGDHPTNKQFKITLDMDVGIHHNIDLAG